MVRRRLRLVQPKPVHTTSVRQEPHRHPKLLCLREHEHQTLDRRGSSRRRPYFHISAWKVNSQNFAMTEFQEVSIARPSLLGSNRAPPPSRRKRCLEQLDVAQPHGARALNHNVELDKVRFLASLQVEGDLVANPVDRA